jgi:hypothetical protein
MNLIKWIIAIGITCVLYPLIIAVCGWLLWISIIVLPFVLVATWIRTLLD